MSFTSKMTLLIYVCNFHVYIIMNNLKVSNLLSNARWFIVFFHVNNIFDNWTFWNCFFLILNKLNLFVYYYYFCIINVYLTTHSITGIGLTTPAGMTYTPLQADASRNKTMFVRSTWTPQQNQVGSHILCALAEDVLGYKLL